MGFLGYKVGMARAEYHDADTNRKNKEAIITPVTIIECPPVKPLALRFYKKTIDGLKCIGEIQNKNLDKELERKIIERDQDLKELSVPETRFLLTLTQYNPLGVFPFGSFKLEK